MGKCYSCLKKKTGSAKLVDTLTPLKPFIPKPESPTSGGGGGGGGIPRPPSVEENEVPDGGTESVLVVQSVDLCIKENAAVHYTDDYDLVQSDQPSLVARRGFPITLKIKFKRAFDKEKDLVCLVFTVKSAKNPSYSQGSMVFTPVVVDSDVTMPGDGWQAELKSVDGDTMTVAVTPAASCIVGEWLVDVDTKVKKDKEEEAKALRYTLPKPIFLLFNPWCKQDSVYMEDQTWRQEYVLSDGGLLWRGTKTRLRPCTWNYGQFEENVLECCCYLLSHVSRFPIVDRSDPVKLTRHISAVVNSQDDNGVLVGNWSNDYGGGQPPTFWSGSVAILQQFYKTKKPVKYGQCWVFSGVCTSICRALGIPARSVTNFASAHDTHNSLTIDYFYDDDGNSMEDLNVDSSWNFHVWNEVWMERPDLEPGGYGGWQAIDATPQEESDDMYRCGPCSVAAIKRGEIQKAYDGPFIFAEVNADIVYWKFRGRNLPLKLIQNKTDAIGCFISTKAIGSYEREDITSNYKYSERTNEEREVMFRALRQCGNSFSRYYLNDNFEDIQFDFQLLDDIVIGSPFNVKLMMKNKGRENKTYTVKGVLRVITTMYNGKPKNLVKKEKFEAKVGEGTDEIVSMMVSYDDYERALVDQASFNISAMATVEETDFDYFAQDDFRVRKPDIKIEVEGDVIQEQELKVTAQLKNPLPKCLRKGMFIIEGPGLGQPLKIPVKKEVQPGKEVEVTCKIRPKLPGEKSIQAKFWSKELDDVDGYRVIQVKASSKPEDGADGKPV